VEPHSTEDDWLASGVAREIVLMSEAIRHPDQPLPQLEVDAKVDPATPSVHVEINGATDGKMIVDLTPGFAWDADGYAPLAQKSLGAGQPTLPVIPLMSSPIFRT
jgi:hypothetical protein